MGLVILFIAIGLVSTVATATPTTHMDRWLQDVTSTSETVRIKALNALGQSGDRRALQPLLTALRDANPSIQQHAKAALKKLAQTLDQTYRHLAEWINTWLIIIGGYSAPPPPVERTLHNADGIYLKTEWICCPDSSGTKTS